MSVPKIITTQSPVTSKARPTLSVLIPFYRDDPSELIERLSTISNSMQTKPSAQGHGVELLVYDDGSDNPDLSRKVSAAVKSSTCPATLFTALENKGRAFGRNYLFGTAKADWVLFLDADMMPKSEAFLDNYVKLIEADAADVIFGGFNVLEEKGEPSRELHRLMSIISDCAPASERQVLGPKNVASSNLCVRKIVLETEPFDNEFTGWGWEDSEWAARIAKTYRLLHAENPALHLGLETTDTLLRRFKTSGPNYLRYTQRHPALATSLPLYQWIKRLNKTPGHAALRPLLKLIVKLDMLPASLRINALKLWRASWYAETVS